MPLADNLFNAYRIYALQSEMEDKGRKRRSDKAIADVYSSGQEIDKGSIAKLLAAGADPVSVAPLYKMLQGESLNREKELNLQSQRGVRGAEALAGAGMQLIQGWKSLPEEKRTAVNWQRGYLATRSNLIRSGIATPEMLPQDLGPQDVEAMIGAGYSPAQQDLSQYREQEAGARQGRFEQSQSAMDRRAAAGRAAADRRAALGRSAAGGRRSDFERTLAAAGIEPGTPDYILAARRKAGLEERLGGGQGIEMSYDAEGRPIVNIGGRGVKLTEQQAKNVVNATAAEQAQNEMDKLVQEGFDPTSAMGAAQVALADVPIVGGMVSEAAKRQASASRNFTAALNYARSGAAITEIEMENTKQALSDKYGDEPEVTEYKRTARSTLIAAIKSGSPNVRALVDDVLARARRPAPPQGVDPERAELERLRSLKAR